MVYDLMRVFASESFIGQESVGVESSTGSNMLTNFILQNLTTAVRHHSSTNLSTALQDAYNSSLIFSASASNAPLPFAKMHVPRFPADEGLINFDFAAELGPEEIILHSEPDSMQHEPCRLLGNSHVTSNFIAADAILAISDQPSCGEPFVQTDSGVFHYSPNFDGEFALCMMLRASPGAALCIELCVLQEIGRA